MSQARSEVKVFLSTVSAEFRSYRDALRHSLDRPNVTVKVQENFIPTGTETLDMLDQYIRHCDVVIHLVGDMTGAMALAPSVAAIRSSHPNFADKLPVAAFLEADGPPMPYTQWEAWLALHHGKRLIIAEPEPDAPRDPDYAPTPEQIAAQQAHLDRLASVERFPGICFRNPDHLAAEVGRSGLFDVLLEAGLERRVDCLPYASLGTLFMGRDADLDAIATRLGPAPTSAEHPTACVALWGLGGIGKTRLALEYAWRRGGGHHARLLLGASSPATLHANLAALCAPGALDLPEHQLTEEARRHAAAIAWLNHHPGWLLILDNADDEAAAAAVEALRVRLTGGHILVTSRLPNWSAAIHPQEVSVLAPEAAAGFLLQRAANRRVAQPDDEANAARLAHELGYLALALEQAGAYIARLRLRFDEYLERWQRQRSKVLEWFDPRLMQYHASVAITWQTSFEQLTPPARRLLQRLAWLAPAPIPASLLDEPIPGEDADPREALVELEALSLARFSDNVGSFTVHRLVQAVTQQDQATDPDHARLAEALQWVNDAFVGDPADVRNWPTLEPLANHAVALANHLTTIGIGTPCTRLFNQAGLHFNAKSEYSEAERLARLALAIDEANVGSNHPNIARDLINLALSLQATDRLTEAEVLLRRSLAITETHFGCNDPKVATVLSDLAAVFLTTDRIANAELLIRRALAIDINWFGCDNPRVAIRLTNLAELLQRTRRFAEAEPLMRRALTIYEAHFGLDHTRVAIQLNNLGQLLQTTGRHAEAEPLLRRALTIDETSYGPSHPSVARDLNNLALLLLTTDRLDDAEPLLHRALAILDTTFSPDHSLIGRTLNNLASLHHANHNPHKAEPLMHRALTIFVLSFGPDNSISQITARNYQIVLHTLGHTDAEITESLRTLLD